MHPSYKDKETLDFDLILDKNYYTNLKNLYICFPIIIRKLTNAAPNIDDDLTTVTNFFAHWIKEIDITKYGTNNSFLPTTTLQEIYKFSKSILKHLPKNAFKMIQNDFLYCKKDVIYPTGQERRVHNSDDATKLTDDSIVDRTDKFTNQIKSKYVNRILLKYLCNLGKINFPTKIDMNIRCTLETEMKKQFESKKRVTNNGAPDAQIVFVKAPFIQYEQMLLERKFRQYLKTIMISLKVLRMGIQKTPYQKTYEMQSCYQELTVDFKGFNRQFD